MLTETYTITEDQYSYYEGRAISLWRTKVNCKYLLFFKSYTGEYTIAPVLLWGKYENKYWYDFTQGKDNFQSYDGEYKVTWFLLSSF